MAQFIKRGNTYDVYDNDALQVSDRLPAGTYTIKSSMERGFFLEEVDEMALPAKIYGNTERHARRIINTFESRPTTTGVLLVGEKGSGKTLLSKQIAKFCLEKEYPVILVNSPLCGPNFNTFVQSISQPVVMIFDEFEKVYDRDDQESILTLLDGVFNSKTLFILTVNDQWKVDQHMKNRPGRLFYRLDFKGLDCEFIRQYCEDVLINKSYIEDICKMSNLFSAFNFDMLKAMVEEMNRYNESPKQVLEMLNARPEQSDDINYSVKLEFNGKKLSNNNTPEGNFEWNGNILNFEGMSFHYRKYREDAAVNQATVSNSDLDYADDDSWNWEEVEFEGTDIKGLDPVTGAVILVNRQGFKATLTRRVIANFNYLQAF